MANSRICSVENCDKPVRVKIRGLCYGHYLRFQKYGSPLLGGTAKNAPLKWLMEHSSYSGDDCIEWPYAKGASGYGRCYDPNRKTIRTVPDFMCEIAHGPKPSPQHESCHSCGNGAAGSANPNHLRWGTHEDNEGDKVGHGTNNAGSRHGCSKLTEAQVIEIRATTGILSGIQAAELYRVSRGTISMIRIGKTWRHL